MRALIVDDSMVMRSILRRQLKDIGAETIEAKNGQEAVEALAKLDGPPDVVMVDWNMPVMNGLDFVRAVRAQSAYADMAILMVTSESEADRVVLALEAGANEYLMKPFSESAVREKLELMGIKL